MEWQIEFEKRKRCDSWWASAAGAGDESVVRLVGVVQVSGLSAD